MNVNDITTVLPDNPDYDAVDKAVKMRRGTYADYNALANKYNAQPVGAVMLLPISTMKVSNLTRILSGRGLKVGQDFIVNKITQDAQGLIIPPAERPIGIKKLTERVMTQKG